MGRATRAARPLSLSELIGRCALVMPLSGLLFGHLSGGEGIVTVAHDPPLMARLARFLAVAPSLVIPAWHAALAHALPLGLVFHARPGECVLRR